MKLGLFSEKDTMTDIVERLRRRYFSPVAVFRNPDGPEAADEIERLRTEVNQLSTSCGHCGDLERAWAEAERLRAALGEMVTTFHDANCHICGGDCASANPPVGGCPVGVIQRARALLEDAK